MNARYVSVIALSFLALLALSGCSEGERGIFATIAIEEEIKKGNLPENTSISGLEWGTVNGQDTYVAGVGIKVFTRSVDGGNWDEKRSPGNRLAAFVAGRYATNGAGLGGDAITGPADEIYVVFQEDESDGSAIYRLASDGSWSQVYTSSATISGMVGVDDVIFVTTVDDDLLIWSSAVSSSPDNTLAWAIDGTGGIRDGVRNGADGNVYYLVGTDGSMVHINAARTTLTPMTEPGASELGGIGYSDYNGDSIIAVTDADGEIFLADTSVGSSSPTWISGADLNGRRSRDIQWISNRNRFLVTTLQYHRDDDPLPRGYYEGEVTGSDNNYSISGLSNDHGNTYNASELAVSSINKFRHFEVSGADIVFALTYGKGLWSTAYPSTGDPEWRWE